jgi:hypothetical protein
LVGGDHFACAYDLSSDGSSNAGSGDGGGGTFVYNSASKTEGKRAVGAQEESG